MFKTEHNRYLAPSSWGLETTDEDVLHIGGCSTVELAKLYGTPLHVLDEDRLQATAQNFLETIENSYPGQVSTHFAFKSNAVPATIQIIKDTGFKAEVMSDFELQLALHLGFSGKEIIINGPYKPDSLLESCLKYEVRFIIIDALEELDRLHALCEKRDTETDILLRVNPHFIPKGMNQGSATGSRKGSAFGLDLLGGEIKVALNKIKHLKRLHFHGFHMHIGTGIFHPKDFQTLLSQLGELVRDTHALGYDIKVFDIGGGLGTPTSREMTNWEMVLYQAVGKLPKGIPASHQPDIDTYAQAITQGMLDLFRQDSLPELLLEPGRCITSANQILLLRVHQVKERPGIKKWILTDGGLGTVSKPTYYEYHEVFLCNEVHRPRAEKVTINGPVCFAADVVYYNKWMPKVQPGEILAIMDSGAYFTAWESSFGFPKPAIIGVKNGKHRVIRDRETFQQMIERDHF
jgi:diaminopimelate decarboxylase